MKKLAKYVSAVLICLFSSVLLVACGEPTITKAYIKEGTIVTTVDRGSAKTALKLNEAVAVVEFSDGEKIEVSADKLTFGDIDLTTIGNDKVLKVKYGDFEFEVEIDVVKPHVTSAYIKANTVNTAVVVGSPLVLANAVAVVTYSNGEQIEVQATDLGFNMATLDLTTVGNDKPLKITYDSFEFYINIDVVADPEDAIVRATSAIITKGTIVDTVIEGATVADLGLDNATALITYDNGTSETVELSAANFATTGLDLSTVGTKTVKVTYVYNTEKNLTIEFYVQIVVEATPVEQKLMISGFSSDLKDDFNNNKKTNKTNKEEQFINTDKEHLVGFENALDFRMNAVGVDPETALPTEDLEGVKTQIKVEKHNGSQYVELTPTEYTQYVETTTYGSIDFTEAAEDKKFKVTVSATNYDSDFAEDYFTSTNGVPSFNLEIKVVEGYNVYDAKGLSLFDNANINNQWRDLKNAWGLSGVTTSTLILQNSIHITDADVPASHFFSQTDVNNMTPAARNATNQPIVGSLKDSAGDETMIYMRLLGDDDKFTLYGNYFEISVADVLNEQKEVVKKGLSRSVVTGHDGDSPRGVVVSADGNSYLTTHTALFKVQGVKEEGGLLINSSEGAEHTSSQGIATIKDAYFIGNAPRSENPLCSGGIILLKSESVNLDVDNTINKDWFIGWMTEYGWDQAGINSLDNTSDAWKNLVNDGNADRNSHTNILNSKGYNNYSSLFYFWGTPNVVIGNSEFVGCGGPVIVTDQITGDLNPADDVRNFFDRNTGFGGFASEIDIYGSKMESYVTGLEAWFATYNADAIFASIKAVNAAYLATQQSSFLTDHEETKNAMNMIVCYKWGVESLADANSFVATRGYARMFDDETKYNAYYDNNNENDFVYHGLDRSITYVDALGRYVYTGKGAQAHLQGLNAAIAGGTDPELGRFENSSNGSTLKFGSEIAPDNVDYATLGVSKTYLNGYLTNGFGVLIELFPFDERPAANK